VVLDVLSAFVVELRQAGLPISLTEHLDAAAAIGHIDLVERASFKDVLRATLVKSEDHLAAFELAFEVFFAARSLEDAEAQAQEPGEGAGAAAAYAAGAQAGAGRASSLSAEELADLVADAVRRGDPALRERAARASVARFAGMEPGRPVGGTYYLYRTLRHLDLDKLLEVLVQERMRAQQQSALAERLTREELGQRIEGLKQAIEAEIRRRLVEDRGAEALARSVRKPLPEDIDVMHATREELAALERALRPLSRKLAVRLTRKRRHGRKGPLDFRQTMRRSLSTGGVPIDPRYRHPHPSKPEIFVIADISGSVASFARFTLQLVYAISAQFSKVRAFVFVDGIDEVTQLFERAEDPGDAIARINAEADVVWIDGHSDYGHALKAFSERWGEEVSSRSSVLILGDARNNYHASEAWVVADLQARARHVYWLNPEPSSYWGSGDSIVGEYAAHCDRVVEVRTLRQLEQFVSELA
jgi:uncharacterized protein with von Willebrand factor type A (vWA) domain